MEYAMQTTDEMRTDGGGGCFSPPPPRLFSISRTSVSPREMTCTFPNLFFASSSSIRLVDDFDANARRRTSSVAARETSSPIVAAARLSVALSSFFSPSASDSFMIEMTSKLEREKLKRKCRYKKQRDLIRDDITLERRTLLTTTKTTKNQHNRLHFR